jgi:hypothetical protein
VFELYGNIGVTRLVLLWIRKGRGTYGGSEYVVWSMSEGAGGV